MQNRYYEEELSKLKVHAVEYARANPALAPMLAGPSTDPDIERLLEGVAFLTGLARQKLDDEFPEFIQEIAGLLFPHYLRPVPATTMIAFEPRGALREHAHVPEGTELASVPVDGTMCVFRTTQPVDVHPLQIRSRLIKESGRPPEIRIDFTLEHTDLAGLHVDSLRLFLSGGYTEASKLFVLLATEVSSIHLHADTDAGAWTTTLSPQALRQAGFDTELIPYPSHAFPGYRNLQEFFVQPEKFLFFDLGELSRLPRCKGKRFSAVLSLRRVPEWFGELTPDAIALNVVPAINLFSHRANPITLDHRQSDYHVRPEGGDKQQYQIHSIDRVISYRQGNELPREYRPFGMQEEILEEPRRDTMGNVLAHAKPLIYRTSLRPGIATRGTDMYLSLLYPPSSDLQSETLSIELTCTNRYLPEALRYGDICKPTASSPERLSFRNIRQLTPTVNPPSGDALHWRLLGHIALNFLSLANAPNLRALLSLYVFSERQEQGNEAINRRRIEGIDELTVEPETRLFGQCVMTGQKIRVGCKPTHYAGVGDMYIFGCVIDGFLSTYASVNSYTRLELEDAYSGEVFTWTPRLGQQALL